MDLALERAGVLPLDLRQQVVGRALQRSRPSRSRQAAVANFGSDPAACSRGLAECEKCGGMTMKAAGRDECVHINPASALHKVFDLRIRYFGLQNAIHRGKVVRPSVKATRRTRCSILKLPRRQNANETRVERWYPSDAEGTKRLARTLRPGT